MKWRKAPEALVQTFKDAVPEAPRVERRTMFGYPCAFIAGNMFGGIYQDTVVVRLPEARRTAAIQREGALPFEPMPGRPMREYVVVPSAAAEDTATLRRWLVEALDYASTLPPKAKGKPRKAGAKAAPKNGKPAGPAKRAKPAKKAAGAKARLRLSVSARTGRASGGRRSKRLG